MSHKKIFIAIVMLTSLAVAASAGQVTMTTYYPSPFGAYQQLRLVPTTPLACDASTEGLMFYDSATDAVKVCKGALGWSPLGGGVWTQAGNNIYPVDTATNPNLNVGIGTTAPAGRLQIYNPAVADPPQLVLDGNSFGAQQLQFMTLGDGTKLVNDPATKGWDFMAYGDQYVSNPAFQNDLRIRYYSGTGQTDVMYFDSATGNVGIGTTTPGRFLSGINNRSLSIAGSDTFDSTRTVSLELTGSNSTGVYPLIEPSAKIDFGHISAGPTFSNIARIAARIGTGFAPVGELSFFTADNAPLEERVRIKDNGNVGIGTDSPANKLDVEGGMAVGATYSGTTAAPTNGMIVEGNVGIGTTDPGTNRLEVVGGPIKATGGLIIETCTGAVADPCPSPPANGQMWLCTDTGDSTPCNGI